MKQTKILIIHPSNEAQRNIHNILSGFDFQLTYATDGLNGLIQAKYDQPDLIISAINVPVLDGFEMCKMIKNDDQIAEMPVVLLHEELNLFYIGKAKEVRAQAFLIKPYLNNSLIYTVKRSLKRNKLIPNLKANPMHFEECQTAVAVSINQRSA